MAALGNMSHDYLSLSFPEVLISPNLAQKGSLEKFSGLKIRNGTVKNNVE